MRLNLSTLFALIALASLTPGGVLAKKEEVGEVGSHVQLLTLSNFSDTIEKEGKVTLVKFYAPWCGHCKVLAPEFELAAAELKDTGIQLAKVDCTEEKDLCQEHKVQGYPTLKVFRKGDVRDFRGQRKADSIVSYMKKQLQPEVTLLTVDTVEEFKDSDPVVVIGFFQSESDDKYAVFKETASQLRDDYLFGAVFDEKAAKKLDLTERPSIILYKKFDDGKELFKGEEITGDAVANFVKTNATPLLDNLSQENFMTYMKSGLPLAYIFFTDEGERKKINDEIKPVAKEYKGKINFVFIDANQFGGHASTLNLKEQWPAFAIQDTEKQTKYPFDQEKEITGEAIRKFVESFYNGDLKPNIKSEPKPETNDGDVKIVVADTYEELVNDKTKDVLIEFYAPWCGHCKKLAPIYEKVAAKYSKHSDKIIIAKMDAIANDIPPSAGFQVEGFPTIKLIKAGTNEAIEFESDRVEEAFHKFIKENASNKLDIEGDDNEESEKKKEATSDKVNKGDGKEETKDKKEKTNKEEDEKDEKKKAKDEKTDKKDHDEL